jgi:hypothetical protein
MPKTIISIWAHSCRWPILAARIISPRFAAK